MELSLSAASALAFAIAIPLIIGLLLGWFLWGRRLAQISDELQSEIERRATSEGQMARVPELQQELARREERNRELTEKLMQAEAQKHSGEEKLKLLFEAKETLSEQFRNLANQIFEEKGAKFAQQSAASLETLLKPLSDKLKDFQGRVEETYDKESKQRFSLQSEIQKLVELNTRMSTDAVNLTNALKGDSKAQGSWGELVLERVLEASGLQKGREYEVQVSMQGEDGKKWQPDVVVKLPEGKHVVIDSKVSLTAYEAYCSGADETVKKADLARHVESIRRHVEELGRKNYQGLYGIRTLDFVLMFVPVEPAFILAAREKQELFIEAIKRNVMIVSPTTLLISLRTIASVWRYEYQNRNAQELVRQCTALYEKFVNFVADLEEVGKKIDAAHKSYEDAHAKLKSGRGNLIRQTERIRELGLKPSKTLPPHLSEAALEEDSEAEIRPLPGIGRSG
jgi:DNA recombination protein RmuC